MSQSTEIVALSQPAFGEKCFLDGYRPDGSRPEGAETYQPKGSALGIGVAFLGQTPGRLPGATIDVIPDRYQAIPSRPVTPVT